MSNRYIDHIIMDEGGVPTLGHPFASISDTNYSITATTSTVLAADSTRRYVRI